MTHLPTGPVVSDDDCSTSSDSSDNNSIILAAANDPFIADVKRHCQRPWANEGATLEGPCRSKRLRRGRNPRPLYPLTGIVLRPSLLNKRPGTHALTAQYQCSFGSKQPSPLAILDNSQASKHKLESLYLAKVTSQDRLLFTNIDWSIPDTPSFLSSSLLNPTFQSWLALVV
jgi:hypothetical protein